MVDRIKQVMNYEQMSPTAFADAIDINRSSLTHIFSGRNQPSLDVAKKILSAFPEISTEWLIMGVGSMFSKEIKSQISAAVPVSVSTVDNMQQTDLFSDVEMSNMLSTPTVPTIKVESVSPEVVDLPAENGMKIDEEPIVEMVPNVVPESVPQTRTRAKISESHNSGRESKRERISNSQGDKKISKIIFFYEDRSFEIYTPN